MTIAPPERAPTDTHDFAPYVRTIGRGPGRARSLTRPEAADAMGMMLRGEATREQIGALLMLLRYRGESASEIAGFLDAARRHAGLPWRMAHPVDLDWPSYADGKTRGAAWYVLAAMLVARAGLRVVMHGPLTGPGRRGIAAVLERLDITPARGVADLSAALASTGFAFVPIEIIAPELAALLALRGVLGLRSPINTVCRLLDPVDARGSIDGVFHPNYITLHQDTAALMGRDVTILKGGGGEAEWSGAKPLSLHVNGREETWPALEGAGKPSGQTQDDVADVWDGTRTDPAAEATIIATTAVALRAAGVDADPHTCLTRARLLWSTRLDAIPVTADVRR